MKYLIASVLIIFAYSLRAQNPLEKSPNEVIVERTNMIKFQGSSANCFALSDSNSIFFITVKHLFFKKVIRKSGSKTAAKYIQVDSPLCVNGQFITINILYHKHWTPFTGSIHFFTQPNSNIDLCIIKVNEKPHMSTLHYLQTGVYLGEECIFMGYPLGLKSPTDSSIDFDLPIVKHAIYSGSYKDSTTGEEVILLDGNNTYGLSGSPVFCFKRSENNWRMIGMVCGYFNQKDSYFNSTSGQYETREENSGVIYGIRASQIQDLLDQIRK